MKKASSRGRQDNLEVRGTENAGKTNVADQSRRSVRARLRALLCGEEEGTQLIELALVAPIMMLMLTGVASFSMALYSYQQLGYATSAAAQSIGAQQGLLPNNDPCAQLVTDITTALPNWTASNFTYKAVITDSGGSPHTFGPTQGSGFSCTPGGADMAQNYPMTITVTYQYNWFSIFTWKPENSFTPSGNLTVSESVMVE
jgi:Flp pilus assembly protein TadG